MPLLPRTTYEIKKGRQKTLVVVPTIFTSFAILFTCLRLYARRLKKVKILVDDYLCILACIVSVAFLGCNVAMVVQAGAGTSVPHLHNTDDFRLWYKLSFTTVLIWVANMAIVQLAMLLYYQRLFWVKIWFRRTCYGFMGIVVAWFLALYIVEFAACQPTAKVWDPLIEGTCADPKKMCNSFGLTHAILDLSVLLLPLPPIWSLHLSVAKKAGLSVVFLVGIFATISSVLRMQCFFEIGSFDPKDPIRSMWLPWVYYSVEIPLAIICCSAPSMAPAFSRLRTSAVGEYMEAFLSRTFRFQTSSKWNTKHDRSMKSTESTEIIRKAVYDEVTVCQGGQAASGR